MESKGENTGDDPVFKYSSTQRKEKTIFQFKECNRDEAFVVTPVNNHCAYISGFNLRTSEESSLKPNYSLVGDEGGKSRLVKGKFILAWFDNYSLLYDNRTVLRFECQRQHLGKTQPGVTVAKRQKVEKEVS